jgi:outer membrane protein assembly factor BamD (BamD/ComL family)
LIIVFIPKNRSSILWLLLALSLSAAPGCQTTDKRWFWQKEDEVVVEQTQPQGQMVLGNGDVREPQKIPVYGGDLAGAKLLFNDKKYAEAEPIFERIAESKKNTFTIIEEAMFHQAECLYQRRKYPQAADHLIHLLNTFPSAVNRKAAGDLLYAIANYWLDETRDDMEAEKAYQEGRRSWPVMPSFPVHFFDETMPDFDIEGRACKCLEAIWMTNPREELGEKALFMLGSVKFFRESYKDADHYFYQIVENWPNGKYVTKALEMSIICKEICTGGADYDGRRLQEARELITRARNSYPEMAKTADPFLVKQAIAITQLQAQKDFNIAGFYERTGHPGSAYFYYEIVKRRYPGTELADKAVKRT